MAAAPFRPLPSGVYFNPSAEECVREYLRPWIAGVRPATDRVIVGVDIYSDHPAALVRGREPGFSREFEHRWLMLTHCVRVCGGRGGKARVKRDVATGGNWKVEQRSKGVVAEEDDDQDGGGDRRRTTGFYLPSSSGGGGAGTKKGKKNAGVKTPWLMEELTTEEDEAAAAGGWRGERAFKVFCKIYISPRATNDEKRDILGEDMVAVDVHGKTKTILSSVPEGLFDALAQNFEEAEGQNHPPPPPPPPPRVLGHKQGKPAVPPPPPPRVLGHRQGQPAAAPPLRVQYGQGQAAATPTLAILRHQHGHAVMPLGVPANHHAQCGPLHPGFLGYRRGPFQIQGIAAPPPQMQRVLDPPYHKFHEASPGVAGYYNNHDTLLYCYPAPPLLRPDPQQGEGMVTHMEKKPRLAYGSPPVSDMSSCVVQDSTAQEKCDGAGADVKVLQEAEPEPTAAAAPPPQEILGTATAPPEPADEAPEAAAESMRECDDIFTGLPELTFVADDGPDFLKPRGTFEPPPDDEPPPPPPPLGFDEFSLEELMKDAPDFGRQPGSLD